MRVFQSSVHVNLKDMCFQIVFNVYFSCLRICFMGHTGECICDEGAGLSDCSIDLTLPPTLSGLWNGGLCDKITEDCTKTYIFGGAFVDSMNLICRVIEVYVSIIVTY